MKKQDKPKKPIAAYVRYKNWYEIKVDGKILGVLFPSEQTEKEAERLKGLMGIEVLQARPETLIEINATTELPKSLIIRWRSAYKKSLKAKRKKAA